MSELVQRAERVARQAHAGQVDKVGRDYVEAHVADVARRVAHRGPEVEAVAWLHDVIEDTDFTEVMLRSLFPAAVVDAVVAITKVPGQSNAVYYARVKANELARMVKVEGDIPSNTDPARVALLAPERAVYFARKYKKALAALA